MLTAGVLKLPIFEVSVLFILLQIMILMSSLIKTICFGHNTNNLTNMCPSVHAEHFSKDLTASGIKT